MFKIDLHGIEFYVVTIDEAEQHKLPDEDCIRLGIGNVLRGTAIFLYRGCLSIEELAQASGHDWMKIDAAVPQDWWDQEYKRTGQAPRAVWTYERAKAFGEPLYLSTMYNELVELAVMSLVMTPRGEQEG